MEVGGINYLIPTDAKIAADRDIGFEAVPLEQVLNAAERAKKLRLVILDACRDNPFANQMKRTLTVASRSVSRGLAAVEPEAGTLVVYAAKDGETALDGDGINSPFASAFVKNLPTPGLEVRRLFDFVRDDVMEATGRKQKPFSYGSISGRQDFYFVAGNATPQAVPSQPAVTSAVEPPKSNGARPMAAANTVVMKGMQPARLDELKASANGAKQVEAPKKDTPADRPKITDRVGQPSNSPVAPVAQKVVLYDEDPAEPQGKQYVGQVVWRTENVAGPAMAPPTSPSAPTSTSPTASSRRR